MFSEHATSDIDSILRYRCIVREQGFGASLRSLHSVREAVDLLLYSEVSKENGIIFNVVPALRDPSAK
jgi:hypothetical protein